MDAMVHAIDIFKFTHFEKVGIWLFDCSSAHEGLTPDVLNVNHMNKKPGRKQRHLQSTTIPLSNPPPKYGRLDTCGLPQDLLFPADHPNPAL